MQEESFMAKETITLNDQEDLSISIGISPNKTALRINKQSWSMTYSGYGAKAVRIGDPKEHFVTFLGDEIVLFKGLLDRIIAKGTQAESVISDRNE